MEFQTDAQSSQGQNWKVAPLSCTCPHMQAYENVVLANSPHSYQVFQKRIVIPAPSQCKKHQQQAWTVFFCHSFSEF
jgi:hypothetical protein